LTQEACAKLVGVATCQYASWETNRHEPRGDSLTRLCEGLKVELAELMGMKLERDLVILWLVKQLDTADRAMVITMLEDLVRRRAVGPVPVVAGPAAVVRPLADQVVSSPVSGEIVAPAGQDLKAEGN
jgi:transcriptional regulator with XRE-family HTH domain